MAKHWARILTALIFVFATISAPLHANATSTPTPAPAAMHMDGQYIEGMSDACAKAMGMQAHKPVKADHSGGCCANGCNCPLSHCPATPPELWLAGFGIRRVEPAAGLPAKTQTLRSYLVETLKRPPRA